MTADHWTMVRREKTPGLMVFRMNDVPGTFVGSIAVKHLLKH